MSHKLSETIIKTSGLSRYSAVDFLACLNEKMTQYLVTSPEGQQCTVTVNDETLESRISYDVSLMP